MITAYSSSQEFVNLALGPATGVRQFIPSPSNSCLHRWGSRDEALVSAKENRCSSVTSGMQWGKASPKASILPSPNARLAFQGNMKGLKDHMEEGKLILRRNSPIKPEPNHTPPPAQSNDHLAPNRRTLITMIIVLIGRGQYHTTSHHGPCGAARSCLFGLR